MHLYVLLLVRILLYLSLREPDSFISCLYLKESGKD